MRAGVVVAVQPGVEDLAVRAEELGLRSFWVNDTPMVHGDPFVALSLCAKATRHIRLGIGVTSPALRSAPAAASAFYTWTLPLPIQPRAGRTVCRHARRIGFSRSRSTVLPRRAGLPPVPGRARCAPTRTVTRGPGRRACLKRAGDHGGDPADLGDTCYPAASPSGGVTRGRCGRRCRPGRARTARHCLPARTRRPGRRRLRGRSRRSPRRSPSAERGWCRRSSR